MDHLLTVPASPGDAIATALKSQYPDGLKGRWSTGLIEVDGFKATVTETASPIVQPSVTLGIQPINAERPTVASLMASGETDANAVAVLAETTATNAAAATAEAGEKLESTLVFAQTNEPVRKIATFLPVSDEMLEDLPSFRSFVDQRLSRFVLDVEDNELLNGAAASAPHLVGLLNRAGVQTGSALSLDTDSSIDAIFRAITAIRSTAFEEPDGLIVHPTDWAGLRLMKDANKQYFGGGPFGTGNTSGDTLWNLRVVVTSRIAQGTVLVGAFRSQAQVFRRGGLVVEASNSHADYFTHNITAVRAEERLALAVYRPAAFYKLTGVDQLMGS